MILYSLYQKKRKKIDLESNANIKSLFVWQRDYIQEKRKTLLCWLINVLFDSKHCLSLVSIKHKNQVKRIYLEREQVTALQNPLNSGDCRREFLYLFCFPVGMHFDTVFLFLNKDFIWKQNSATHGVLVLFSQRLNQKFWWEGGLHAYFP